MDEQIVKEHKGKYHYDIFSFSYLFLEALNKGNKIEIEESELNILTSETRRIYSDYLLYSDHFGSLRSMMLNLLNPYYIKIKVFIEKSFDEDKPIKEEDYEIN